MSEISKVVCGVLLFYHIPVKILMRTESIYKRDSDCHAPEFQRHNAEKIQNIKEHSRNRSSDSWRQQDLAVVAIQVVSFGEIASLLAYLENIK